MDNLVKSSFSHADKKVVLVVGGGFAGLKAAKTLANKPGVHVVLSDQRNHHLFQPLLYQVATAGLNPSDIAVPIRAQFSHAENVEVHLGRITSVDLPQKTAQFPDFHVKYDFLILACGAQHSYFSHPEWEFHAPGLKTLEQATEIRRRILSAFEAAENENDPLKQKSFLTFVVIGGGPTGVELAGAIADISRTVLVNDFKRIDASEATVLLLEAGPRILSSFPEDLSLEATRELRDIGVDVRTSTRVEMVNEKGVTAGTEFIPAKCVFWGAGVEASKLSTTPALEIDRAGRIKVKVDFSLPQFPEVFVVGDMASFEFEPGKFLPGLAPVAIQSGQHAAETILATVRGKPRNEFRYFDKGQMATIGKHRAIAMAGKLKMSGYIAWLTWLFVHVFYLIGFKNRVSVMAQWAWSYLFSKRGSRLITEKDWMLKR